MKPYIASHSLLARLGLNPDSTRLFLWQDATGSTTYATSTARSQGLIAYKVDGGRVDARSRTSALRVTCELARALCTAPDIGDRFRITLDTAAAAAMGLTTDQAVRFTGMVTDVQDNPAQGIVRVAGVGRMVARLSRTVLLSSYVPDQLDGDRARSVLLDAGYTSGDITASGGWFRLPVPEVPEGQTEAAVTAQSYLDAVSDSTLAQLVEERTGKVRWATLDQRGEATSAATLDSGELLNDFEWRKGIGDVLNAATAGSSRSGDQAVVDGASIQDLDGMIYDANVSGVHRCAYPALALAGTIVALFSSPRYRLPALEVDLVRSLSTADAAAVVKLSHGQRIDVTGLPTGGPYTSTAAYVEGWSEQALPRSWRMTLNVTDPYLSADSVTIGDAPVGLEWSEVDPDLTFLDAAHITTPGGLAA